eukprot:CAMPEP_0201488316 /NCGR_PEP_ID=MMETSP0151_2-20130828/17886_1 /ASSEMBLY_ACC=CAM_ASM_000257 /TAXON_ID=200890 /ORGANISM="Paramoeba atlantica, Strain 621/1 / CCAP 1560/9" /LENGTH=528 /DNA_ID=CAMNT_0047873579 /DNA_START=85 /DNA_END=1671 /DNA_ORIENTATION=-
MPWITRVDPTTGRQLAANPETFECLWDTPQEILLPGYEQHFDTQAGQWYYVDTKTDLVTYEVPLINTDGPAFVKANNVGQNAGQTSSSMIGRRREGAIGNRGAPSSSNGSTFMGASDLNLKHSRALADLPSGSGPTLAAEKQQSLNSKVKMNPYQLEGFAKTHFSKGKPLTQNQLKSALKYSKEKQSTPLIFSLRETHSKSVTTLWKHTSFYMEGKKLQAAEKVSEIFTLVFQAPEIRDELYCQLCKQTCYNPRQQLNLKCWELFTVICACVQPSSDLEPYLVAYLREQLKDHKEKEAVYAACCLRRLRQTLRTGMPNSPPSIPQIENWISTAFDPYLFELPLSKVMENQKAAFPDLSVPIILPHMTQLIVQLGGFRTEGIFRIPGDVDLVHQMKLQVESGNFDNFDTKDPRAPSSLLSLWLRELKDPLIPDPKYDECLQCANDPQECVEVINSLPQPNKDTMIFLIKFLQSLISEENQPHTKMGAPNVAMVFAPNFLRCRSPHPAIMLQNAKAEQQFVINVFSHFKG